MFVAWWLLLPAAPGAGASSLVVQRIGDTAGRIHEAVASEAVASDVTIVPFSPGLDARATPIIIATGKAFLSRQGDRVLGLRPAERSALRRAYAAGQVILLLDASTHDIEALHALLDDGVTHESSTDPSVLAYALRQVNRIATARLVIHPPVEDELASSQALEVVLEELTRPPAAPEDDAPASSDDWKDSPVQQFIITSTTNGTYNTPIDIYALHACEENKDYYLVNTGGDWTPTQAHYESAAWAEGQISVDENHNLTIDWQQGEAHCEGGIDVSGTLFGNDERICRYMNYPLSYEVDIVPPSGPTVVQANAAPPGDQGLSSEYESGFSFSIDGEVEVSGEGPSGGLQAGVEWSNSVSTEVPPLVVHAGDTGNEGAFTNYLYCTGGNTVANCTSSIQMTGQSGLCQQLDVGSPQNGQTPNGRLSEVAQTVNWQVDPGTYTGSTFDITVTWTVQLATSTSKLWADVFTNFPPTGNGPTGPTGDCNHWGCSCGIELVTTPITVSHTFNVSFPTSSQCPS
ncbi:MAG: hypothetical protein ACREJ0_18665 [Geminicoccaceae bacterium]